MTDIATRIRERLSEDSVFRQAIAEHCEYSASVVGDAFDAADTYANAIRAVLDMCDDKQAPQVAAALSSCIELVIAHYLNLFDSPTAGSQLTTVGDTNLSDEDRAAIAEDRRYVDTMDAADRGDQ